VFGDGKVRAVVQMLWHLLMSGSASFRTKIQWMGDKSGCGLGHKSAIVKFNQFLIISAAQTVCLKAGWKSDTCITIWHNVVDGGQFRKSRDRPCCLYQMTDFL